MAYTSKHRGARISSKKVIPILGQVRGQQIDDAIILMQMSKRRGAYYLRQVLETAKANAIEQGELSTQDARRLVVKSATVDQGQTIKRFQPKDRGRAHPILKRSSHITVSLDHG